MAYLYNYVGEPWKTQFRVHQIMKEFYKPEPNGLIGNEDCGQMSAWYVFAVSAPHPEANRIATNAHGHLNRYITGLDPS
jgi:putative alpha-1,2-mannosidase